MTNKFIAGLAAAVAAFMPVPALASGLELREYPEHHELFETIEDVGVTIVINDPIHCDGTVDGAYGWVGDAGYAWLYVCQDGGEPGGLEVRWSQNDLDTLRHEAHHLVQDCLVGGFGDGRLSLLFNTPEKMKKFLELSGASLDDVKKILWTYRDTSEEVQWREVEAFWVARGVGPDSIAEAIKNHCTK